jgi:hypothetical protein
MSAGNEGTIFSLNDNEILKIYKVSMYGHLSDKVNFVKLLYGFNSIEELLQNRIDILDRSHNQGLRVPKPLGIEKMTIEEVYDRCGKHKLYVERLDAIMKKNPQLAKKLEMQLSYGIRKEFITGKSLGHNFIPSLRLKHLVQETYKDFYEKDIIIHDERPSNYILNNNQLYVIDEGSLVDKAKFNYTVKSTTFGFHTYYSDKALLGYYLLEGWVSAKLHQKMIKKGIIPKDY